MRQKISLIIFLTLGFIFYNPFIYNTMRAQGGANDGNCDDLVEDPCGEEYRESVESANEEHMWRMVAAAGGVLWGTVQVTAAGIAMVASAGTATPISAGSLGNGTVAIVGSFYGAYLSHRELQTDLSGAWNTLADCLYGPGGRLEAVFARRGCVNG